MPVSITEPTTPLKFEITDEDVDGADPKDPCQCVIARAFRRIFDATLLEVQVYSTKTTLTFTGGRIQQYRTPPVLREALDHFDQTSNWQLPAGKYSLLPQPQSSRRETLRERAAKRRERKDPHMETQPAARKKTKVATNHRLLNLVALRKRSPVPGKPGKKA